MASSVYFARMFLHWSNCLKSIVIIINFSFVLLRKWLWAFDFVYLIKFDTLLIGKRCAGKTVIRIYEQTNDQIEGTEQATMGATAKLNSLYLVDILIGIRPISNVWPGEAMSNTEIISITENGRTARYVHKSATTSMCDVWFTFYL